MSTINPVQDAEARVCSPEQSAHIRRRGPIDADVHIVNTDCFGMLSGILHADAIITDPPYGIGYKVNVRNHQGGRLKSTGPLAPYSVAPIHGDDEPFDPAPWLQVPKVAFFGANHFSSRLPEGRWLIWDKRRDSTPDDHADADMIWMSTKGVTRIHRQKWRGVVREGEENCSRSKKLHPNQKPVALLTALVEMMDLPKGSLIADPFMGSGSMAIVALRMGMRFIGCEIDPIHYETARSRIAAERASLQLQNP